MSNTTKPATQLKPIIRHAVMPEPKQGEANWRDYQPNPPSIVLTDPESKAILEERNKVIANRIDEHRAWREQAYSGQQGGPIPEREQLMVELHKAKQHQSEVSAQLATAQASLNRVLEVQAQAQTALNTLDEIEAKITQGFKARLREWVTEGGTGDRPVAKASSEAAAKRQDALAFLTATDATVEALQAERDVVKVRYDEAHNAVCAAARAVIRLDAIEEANKINQLHAEAAHRWHNLWGMTYTWFEGAPITSHPIISGTILEKPRLADQGAVTEKTRRSAEASARVQTKFKELVEGT